MANIIPIELNKKGYVTVLGIDGNVYITPITAYEKLIRGELSFQDFDHWEIIMRGIVKEWLERVIFENG